MEEEAVVDQLSQLGSWRGDDNGEPVDERRQHSRRGCGAHRLGFGDFREGLVLVRKDCLLGRNFDLAHPSPPTAAGLVWGERVLAHPSGQNPTRRTIHDPGLLA